MRLTIGDYPDEVWILRSADDEVPPGAEPIAAERAIFLLHRWLFGLTGRVAQADLAAAVGLPFVVGPRAFDPWVERRIRDAFARGELRAYRPRVALSGAPVAPTPEPPEPEPTDDKEEKTFVVIELLDDANPPQPVAYEKYRIELPDYSVREGMLDQNGRAEITGIDPGQCKVTFPNLLREDWWLSGSAG